MSSRPQFNPAPVFNATTGQSMTGSLTSKITIIQKLSMVSYGFSWTGASPVGTISIEVSNDYSDGANGVPANAGTWTALTFSSNGSTTNAFSVSGNTGGGFLDIDQIAAYAIRAVYTAVSGSGTLSGTINAKVA